VALAEAGLKLCYQSNPTKKSLIVMGQGLTTAIVRRPVMTELWSSFRAFPEAGGTRPQLRHYPGAETTPHSILIGKECFAKTQ